MRTSSIRGKIHKKYSVAAYTHETEAAWYELSSLEPCVKIFPRSQDVSKDGLRLAAHLHTRLE